MKLNSAQGLLRINVAFTILILILTACTNNSTNTAPSASPPTNAPDSTSTETLVISPTPTRLPDKTPTISATDYPATTQLYPTPYLPNLNGKNFFLGELLFDDSSECSLPCWRSLIVGQSKREEVLSVLETTFGPTNFEDRGGGVVTNWDSISGIYYNGFQYTVDRTFDFYFSAGFDETTDTLSVLRFGWATSDSDDFEIHLSPQLVIQHLGAPSHMFARHGPRIDQITLLIIYDEGIVFEYISEMIDSTKDSRRYCFGNTKLQTINSAINGNFYIIDPFDDGLVDLSPLQDASVGASLRWHHYMPFEDLFGISTNEVAALIFQEENTCIAY